VIDESRRPLMTGRERAAADPTAAPPQLGRKGLNRASVMATAAYGTKGVNAAISSLDKQFGVSDDEDEGGEEERQVLGPGDSLAEVSYFT